MEVLLKKIHFLQNVHISYKIYIEVALKFQISDGEANLSDLHKFAYKSIIRQDYVWITLIYLFVCVCVCLYCYMSEDRVQLIFMRTMIFWKALQIILANPQKSNNQFVTYSVNSPRMRNNWGTIHVAVLRYTAIQVCVCVYAHARTMEQLETVPYLIVHLAFHFLKIFVLFTTN